MSEAPPKELAPRELLRYSAQKRRLRKGNHAVPLRDGVQAFPAMMEAIRSAAASIHAEFYIWRGDQTGWSFADALIERARAGISVRIMYDALGCIDVDPLIFDTMMAAGIEVHQYGPLAPWRPRWGLWRRMHRKVLIVDDSLCFLGGLNLADDYAPADDGGKGWRDQMVMLRGPVVRDVIRVVANTWERERKPGQMLPRPKVDEAGDMRVAILSNNERGQRGRIRSAYIRAIKSAERSICIANAYFLPGVAVRRALYTAAKRGVEVRIIVPAVGDVPVVAWATQYLYKGLLRRGIRVFEWTGVMIHAKIATIDGVWSTIGSYNLDRRSLRSNLEINAMVLDRPFGEQMVTGFEADFDRCAEVTLQTVKRRGWLARLRSWLAYQLRALL